MKMLFAVLIISFFTNFNASDNIFVINGEGQKFQLNIDTLKVIDNSGNITDMKQLKEIYIINANGDKIRIK